MKRKLTLLAVVCALFVLIAASHQVIESCRYGLRLCIELILPSLFPFFLFLILLSRLGFPAWLGRILAPAASRLFHVSGAGVTALFVGLTGGYPMGAAYLAELMRDGTISHAEGERLLGFCNNSGPAFLVGAMGAGVFGSARIGLLLYTVHASAALLTGLLLRGKGQPPEARPTTLQVEEISLARLLPDAVSQSVAALLNVCGFVVCFSVFTGLLDSSGLLDNISRIVCSRFQIDPQALRALLIGFWELGSGIGALRGLSPTPLNLAFAAMLVGWGGLSVHFQTLAVLSDVDTKSALHTAGRFLSSVLSFSLMYALSVLRS